MFKITLASESFLLMFVSSLRQKTHKCAVSIKSQWATQVLLIFHQDYSWINAFKVLLKDQFHDLFRRKTVRHVACDVTAMHAPRSGRPL